LACQYMKLQLHQTVCNWPASTWSYSCTRQYAIGLPVHKVTAPPDSMQLACQYMKVQLHQTVCNWPASTWRYNSTRQYEIGLPVHEGTTPPDSMQLACQYINLLSLLTTHLTALKSRNKWRTIVIPARQYTMNTQRYRYTKPAIFIPPSHLNSNIDHSKYLHFAHRVYLYVPYFCGSEQRFFP